MITRPLALLGFPCSGKTTLGKALAQNLGLNWLDSDAEVEACSGRTPAYWLQTLGEPGFREIERAWLETWEPKEPCVLSTGGGLPCYHDNLKLLKAQAVTIYLKADFAVLLPRLQSPPHPLTRLYERDRLEQLYEFRDQIYKRADLTIDANGSVEAMLQELIGAGQTAV